MKAYLKKMRKSEFTETLIKKTPAFLTCAIPVIIFAISFWAFMFYVKDDAYITFRFSKNLVNWGEISFNKGSVLEGYTNFLWMILLTIPVATGIDQLVFAKLLSVLFSCGAVIFVKKLHDSMTSMEKGSVISGLFSASIFAASTSFSLWTMSGLENGFFMFLVTGGVYFLFTSSKLPSAFFLTLACMTRPEGHLFLVFGGAYILYSMLKNRKVDIKDILWFAVPFIILGFYHIFRYFYFGNLWPNTFLVKGSPNISDVFRINFDNGFKLEGTSVKYLRGLFKFNFNWLLAILSLFGLLPGKNRKFAMKFFFFAVFIGFILYHIKIGKDSMIFYRLFLPALPFVIILAVEGVKNIFGFIPHIKSYKYLTPVILALPVSINMLNFTWSDKNDYLRSYIEKSIRSHQQYGRFLNENSKKNDVVLFQDMGGTPYIAENVTFFDPIGVVNAWMGKELSKINYNPFLHSQKMRTKQGTEEVRKFNAKFRNHIMENVKPERIAFIAYSPKYKGKYMSETIMNFKKEYFKTRNVRFRRFNKPLEILPEDRKTIESFFNSSLRNNRYYHGLYSDIRFKRNYKLESFWRRTEHYWIVSFVRL